MAFPDIIAQVILNVFIGTHHADAQINIQAFGDFLGNININTLLTAILDIGLRRKILIDRRFHGPLEFDLGQTLVGIFRIGGRSGRRFCRCC
ncbi:MAG: hypothetical protein R3E95_07745 [Thiolinea sp.]